MHLLENPDEVGNIPYINIYMKYGLGLAGEDRPCQSGPWQCQSPCRGYLGCLGCLSFPWRCFISQQSPEGLHFKTSSVICWAKKRTTFMHSLL